MLGPDESEYVILRQKDGAWAVEVRRPNDVPNLVEGFASQADAQTWIDEKVIAAGASDKLPDGFDTFRRT